MGIKVIALVPGYYGHFRESGDEFEIDDEKAFHASWMEKLDGKRTKRITGASAQATGNNPVGGSSPNPELDPLV